MGLRFLEHVLILTHDPEATRDWFCDNLGFTNGYHPEFGFPVYWLYIGDQDVLHIGKARSLHHQSILNSVDIVGTSMEHRVPKGAKHGQVMRCSGR